MNKLLLISVLVVIVAAFAFKRFYSHAAFDLDALIEESDFLSSSIPKSRSFRMGFTYQPYDWNDAAFAETAKLIRDNGDLITIFDDTGIPWVEAYREAPYHPNVQMKLTLNKSALKTVRGTGHAVVVVSSALGIDRRSLAGYAAEEEPMPRPGVWAQRDLTSPEVATAYLNYAYHLIELYDPDYFCYLAEVNAAITESDTPEFEKIIVFASRVYPNLKQRFPNLEVCIEFMLGNGEYMAAREAVAHRLLPYTDVFPVSTYPFHEDTVGGDARNVPDDWFSNVRAHALDKRVAILETSFAAENFMHPTLGISVPGEDKKLLIPGGQKSQAIYIRRLLEDAQDLNALFVNLWNVRDTDRLSELIAQGDTFADPLWTLPQDSGLFDENGQPRSALSVWRQWIQVPLH